MVLCQFRIMVNLVSQSVHSSQWPRYRPECSRLRGLNVLLEITQVGASRISQLEVEHQKKVVALRKFEHQVVILYLNFFNLSYYCHFSEILEIGSLS